MTENCAYRGSLLAIFIVIAANQLIMVPTWAVEISASTALAREALPRGTVREFGPPPMVRTGALDPDISKGMETLFVDGLSQWGSAQQQALATIAQSKDPRLAWVVVDLLRFVQDANLVSQFTDTINKLLNTNLNALDVWHEATDHLIAWDIPAPPDYLRYKRSIYTTVLPDWAPLFVEGDIDWRYVAWGGVRMDDRPYDQTDEPCNCIPAADNPAVVQASEASWLSDDAVVFGVTVNGESRAYPRRIMEVREMINDTLGGRDLGIPYCTLCGSAQAWFTDNLPADISRPVLRTSGLLIRSNKVMYDLNTYSVFDTFLGTAVTGPLAKRNIKLESVSVVTTTWADWRKSYPNTTVLVEALALGRDFDFRNNRDANGPIFPIGDVDPRLPVQEDILGVVTASGTPIAFHVQSLVAALDAGHRIRVENVEVVMDARGVRAIDVRDGTDLGTHQAFWFAWSQFHPGTRLWPES